jgi:predicted nucleotidyltransferase
MTSQTIIKELKCGLSKHFSPDDGFVFIFGSRADGKAKPNSDWDIGVIGRKKIAGSALEKARESLESIRTLQTFELVDFRKVPDSFKKMAMQKIIPLIGENVSC